MTIIFAGGIKMFINYSNHPSAGWMDDQKNAASMEYGSIVDVPFPAVPVGYTSDDIRQLAELLRIIQAVTDYKQILNFKSGIIRLDLRSPP